MKGEFDALRKVARVASEYLEIETLKTRNGAGLVEARKELVVALDDLWIRFPHTIEAVPSLSARLFAQARLAVHAPATDRPTESADSEESGADAQPSAPELRGL